MTQISSQESTFDQQQGFSHHQFELSPPKLISGGTTSISPLTLSPNLTRELFQQTANTSATLHPPPVESQTKSLQQEHNTLENFLSDEIPIEPQSSDTLKSSVNEHGELIRKTSLRNLQNLIEDIQKVNEDKPSRNNIR